MKLEETGRLILLTVGFESHLPLRGLLRIGVSPKDQLLLIYPSSGGEYEQKRVQNTVQQIKNITSNLGISIAELPLPCTNFDHDIISIIREIKKVKKKKAVAILAGGMRILIPEVVSALLALRKYWNSNLAVEFFFMREDGLYEKRAQPDYFIPPDITDREIEVLNTILELGRVVERPRVVKTVVERLNVTESMAYKFITTLSSKRVIRIYDNHVELTPLGIIVLEAKWGD